MGRVAQRHEREPSRGESDDYQDPRGVGEAGGERVDRRLADGRHLGPDARSQDGQRTACILTSPPSAADRDQEIDRLLALGARRVDIGQTGAESWTILADPDGSLQSHVSDGNRRLSSSGWRCNTRYPTPR